MKNIHFSSPMGLELGNGVIKDLAKYLKKLGVSKCLVVTDEVLKNLGMVDRILNPAKAEGIEFVEYCGVQPEPPVSNPTDAYEVYKANACEGIVGIGGGSPMDVAKATSILATNPAKYEDYVGINKVPNKGCPLILVPTIAGSGSEVGMFSIMMLGDQKAGVVDRNLLPDYTIIDPELTLSCPRGLTAATGLDGLCHLIESYISNLTNPMAEMICLEGIHYMTKYLPKAVGDGQNLEARYWVSYASYLGIYGNNLTDGSAANHGFAFAAGAKYHLSHGLSNAIFLPHVFPCVAKSELDRLPRLARAMELNVEGLSGTEVLEVISEALRTITKDVGCMIPLSKLGGKAEDIDELVEMTIAQTRVMGHSSWQLTSDEIRTIFEQAM